jgi:ankyrin repeat protein
MKPDDFQGYYPYFIHIAIRKQETSVVDALIAAGANLEVRLDGFPPLISAIIYGNIDIVYMLIEAGADVHAEDRSDFLGAGSTALWWAARRGDIEVISLLLAKGAKVDKRSIEGWTPLFAAAHYNKPDAVRALLDAGADIDAKTHPIMTGAWMTLTPSLYDEKSTPIFTAADQGHIDVVRLLIERGANVNLKKNGCTPLDAAKKSHHTEIENMLLDAGGIVACVKGLSKGGRKRTRRDMNKKRKTRRKA